jgi:two-component system, NtrC family, sensor histidine kinase HydH
MATARGATSLVWTRWLALAAVVLMGGALLVSGWITYRGVRNASEDMLRGQIDELERALRRELMVAPSDETLARFLDENAAAGLRYVAFFDASGAVLAEAGTPAGLGPPRPGERRRGAVMVVGDRVRVELRRAVLEIEPVQVKALRVAAARTFGIGALAASALVVVAVVLLRWILRREALERQLAHERRLASLGEMSAVLAHEIRNPLASLKGNAQLLAEQLPAGDKPRHKADRVVAEAVRLERLTNDLLAFVRTGELRREPVDPAALLREAAGDVSAAAPAAAIEVDGAPAPARWSLDPERMRQVLRNLLDNAVTAGPPVRASVSETGGELVYQICDHGPGVTSEDAERIFEPFFTRRAQGTGLGLAVARRIVELHGGSIGVDTAPGGGARFRVAIPGG